MQKYTQSGGVRPFGIAMLVIGFDPDGTPNLFTTDPSGTYSAWKANAVGPAATTVREFLEKHYTDEVAADDAATVKLTIKALLEVMCACACVHAWRQSVGHFSSARVRRGRR